jgi:hypothetical protein
MALVMTVRNPAGAVRATWTRLRANVAASAHVPCARRIDRLINKNFGPRADQTAMRGTRLPSSLCMTDRVM